MNITRWYNKTFNYYVQLSINYEFTLSLNERKQGNY